MRETADQLESFYAAPLGRMACDMAMRRLHTLWPDLAGNNAMGFGYAAPYLDAYRKSANRIVLVNPAGQGAIAHRSSRGVMGCVADETQLPFSDATFDRVLCVHAVEEADDLPGLLRELWRVTQPEGRIVVIAAGRSGLWSRMDHLPFGAGRPFSRGQLRARLLKAGFTPTVGAGALYGPPVARLSGPKISYGFERFGETVWPGFAGLVMVEAIRRLYVEPDRLETAKVRAPLFGAATRPTVEKKAKAERVE
ncbi:class I SAM-dependent methyltransferase [uncultured Algimonas sp.]|uniref:class I SAM-dependent methyltransferase n=1 Tax=uncultured Algimonas sp. TaxID=1547920 RepID=UPI002621946D|nr:class I SAM-dependent methyltransferase [uncultured Algimonas sp.]